MLLHELHSKPQTVGAICSIFSKFLVFWTLNDIFKIDVFGLVSLQFQRVRCIVHSAHQVYIGVYCYHRFGNLSLMTSAAFQLQ